MKHKHADEMSPREYQKYVRKIDRRYSFKRYPDHVPGKRVDPFADLRAKSKRKHARARAR
jgi:hypothetical protein